MAIVCTTLKTPIDAGLRVEIDDCSISNIWMNGGLIWNACNDSKTILLQHLKEIYLRDFTLYNDLYEICGRKMGLPEPDYMNKAIKRNRLMDLHKEMDDIVDRLGELMQERRKLREEVGDI